MKKTEKGVKKVQNKYVLDEIDHLILQNRIKYPDITDKDLAALVGLSPKQVNKRRNAKKFEKAIEAFFKPAAEALADLANEAIQVFRKSLRSDNEKIRVKVAERILISVKALKVRPDEETDLPEPTIIELPEGTQVIMGLKPAVETHLQKKQKAD